MKYIHILLLSIFCLSASSCSKWLDVMPKTSIPEDELFKNEFGFKDAFTGFYIKMGASELYGRELTYHYMDMLAGRYDLIPNVSNREDLYNYDGTFKSTKNTFFLDTYNIIANINNMLKFMDANRSAIVTPHYYETMKGEALALRAFLQFDLLRMFGPVYAVEPQGKSIPYRTQLDNVATPVLPASEVVELCLKDLHEAEALLNEHDSNIFKNDPKADQFTIMRQYRMNKWAVKATLARVYLYKGDAESKAKALKYADEVIESSQFLLYENNNDNRVLFDEVIFGLYVYELNKVVDPDFINISPSSVLSLSAPRYEQLFEKKGAGVSDFRCGTYAFRSVKFDSVDKLVLQKYDQSGYRDDYAGRGAIPLIRLPEMYYIKAECEPNPKLAAEYINTVRFARGIALSDAIEGNADFHSLDTRGGYDTSKTVLVNELMKEYQKEFYGEGQLFYFYKRQNYQTFFGLPSGVDITAKYKLPLPGDEITFGK